MYVFLDKYKNMISKKFELHVNFLKQNNLKLLRKNFFVCLLLN